MDNVQAVKVPVCVSAKKKALSSRGINNFSEWVKRPSSLYIGRDMTRYVEGAVGSKWGNPFTPKHGDLSTRLALYEERVRASAHLMSSLGELEDRELGCWCKPAPCHGDVLIKLYCESVHN